MTPDVSIWDDLIRVWLQPFFGWPWVTVGDALPVEETVVLYDLQWSNQTVSLGGGIVRITGTATIALAEQTRSRNNYDLRRRLTAALSLRPTHTHLRRIYPSLQIATGRGYADGWHHHQNTIDLILEVTS